MIIFFSVFLFHFSGLNFLSPIILFHPGNISSLKLPTRGEYICDLTEKCGLSVHGHQLSHCLGAAGFPQVSQGFTEVSTQSLDQNKKKIKRWLALTNRNSASLVHTETLKFSYLSWVKTFTDPFDYLSFEGLSFWWPVGGNWCPDNTDPISGNFAGEELTVANQILKRGQLPTSVSICFRTKTFHTWCKLTWS